MDIVVMVLVAALVFGAIIMAHEVGHFAAAKLSGIKVNEFSIGMGPALLKFGKKETQYSLRLLPIGGYVAMEGEDDDSEDARGFRNASLPKRLFVMVAGALMNFLLGFLALVLIFSFSGLIGTTTVLKFTEGATTQQSGLQEWDTIVRVNGRRTFVMADVFYEFERTKSSTIDMQVRRDGELVDLPGVQFLVQEVADPGTETTYQQLKLDFIMLGVPPSPGAVIKVAWASFLSFGRYIYLMLFDLVTGHVPINDLSGPVGIVSEIGKAVSYGWQTVVNFMALISINLGIMNLLPLPALDGGKVLLIGVEAIRRKPLSTKVETAVTIAGFVLLFGLMIFATFNDIRRIFFA